jgi:choline-glycine betaine transporter
MKYIKTTAVYVYVVLTIYDIKKLLLKIETWRIFGGVCLLFLSMSFLMALQTQQHLPLLSIVLAVPFSLILLIIAVTILKSK